LTGDTPFGRPWIHDTPVLEVLRRIREDDPPPPSRRGGLLQAGTNSRQRQELDWVVLKCLAKDRARRYETAGALIEDVRRFLNDEPLLAGEPGKMYRLRKFLRRNRSAAAAAFLFVLALVGGIVGTSIGLVRASQQRTLAQSERDEKMAALKSL